MAATVRYAIVAAACVLGGLAALSCVIAAIFELQGFGAPRDTGARPLYVASLLVGLAASVLAPIAVWRVLLPENAPPVVAGVAVFAAAVVLMVAISGFG